jgi:hypothetical protein
MLTERFQGFFDQRLRQSPVQLLSPRTLPLALMLSLPRGPMSTVEGAMLLWRRLLLIVPNVYFQMFRNREMQ